MCYESVLVRVPPVVSIIMAPRSVVNYLAAHWRLHQKTIKEEAKASAATSDYDDKLKAIQADVDESQNFLEDKMKKMEEMMKSMSEDLMNTAAWMAAKTATACITKSMEAMVKQVVKEIEERAKEIEERVDAVEEKVVEQLVEINAFAAQTRHIQERFAKKLIGSEKNVEKVKEFAIQTREIQHVIFTRRLGEDY